MAVLDEDARCAARKVQALQVAYGASQCQARPIALGSIVERDAQTRRGAGGHGDAHRLHGISHVGAQHVAAHAQHGNGAAIVDVRVKHRLGGVRALSLVCMVRSCEGIAGLSRTLLHGSCFVNVCSDIPAWRVVPQGAHRLRRALLASADQPLWRATAATWTGLHNVRGGPSQHCPAQ